MAISKPLEIEHAVDPSEIDELGHVNNQVYLDWLMGAATRHSRAVGWDLPRLIQMGEGWVVRRHEIEYLLPVKLGDTVTIRTWVETAEKVTSERYYEIYRSDGKKACTGKTMWVWINYGSGRPARIPQQVIQSFVSFEPNGPVKW